MIYILAVLLVFNDLRVGLYAGALVLLSMRLLFSANCSLEYKLGVVAVELASRVFLKLC